MFKQFRMLGAMAAVAALAALVTAISPPIKQAQAAAAPALSIFSATYGASTLDLADGAGATVAVGAPGAILGDACVASISEDSVDMLITCSIVAADSAEVRVQNESTASSNLAGGTVRVFLFPRGTR